MISYITNHIISVNIMTLKLQEWLALLVCEEDKQQGYRVSVGVNQVSRLTLNSCGIFLF